MSSNRIKGFSLGLALAGLSFAIAAPALADHVSGTDAQASFDSNIPLGTSGSSREHLQIKNRLFCYTGTLGALVEDLNGRYILSNNHVLAKENELLDTGSGDEVIIQPGLLDGGTCTLNSGADADPVASLSEYVMIDFSKGKNRPENRVDAAIALADDTVVDMSGRILGIGTVSGDVAAEVDLEVQKTGRTTGHTFGTVAATHVTVDVRYESGTARFVDQIRIRHVCDGADFSDSGDSGSLITTVPAVGGDPAAVGLLFAGGDADTFANPIRDVLTALSVDIATASDDNDNVGAMAADHKKAAANCTSDGGDGGNGGRPGNGRGGPPFRGLDPLGLEIAAEVKARHSQALFALPDVVGHGIGTDSVGNAVIEIYVASKARRAAAATPAHVEGIPVRVVETGVIRAF